MKLRNLLKALSLFALMSCAEAQQGICKVTQNSSDQAYYLTGVKGRVGTGIFRYESENLNIASVDSKTGKITSKLKPGQRDVFVTVVVTQLGNTNYYPSKKSCRLLLERQDLAPTVVRVMPERSSKITPTLSCPRDVTIFYGTQSSMTASRPASNSQGKFSYHIAQNQQDVAAVDNNTGNVTIHGVGEATIQAKQEQYGDYIEGSCQYTLTVKKVASQIVVVNQMREKYEPGSQTLCIRVNGADKSLQPIGRVILYERGNNNSLAFTKIAGDSVADLSFNLATLGQHDLTVVYEGDQYHTSSQLSLSRAIARRQEAQTIIFQGLSNRIFGNGDTVLKINSDIVRSSSGLPVNLRSVTKDVCVVDNNSDVTLKDIGTCTLVANQAGNDAYAQANEVRHSFQVEMGQFQFFGTSELRTGVFGWPYGTGGYADSAVNISGHGAGIAPYTYRLAEGQSLPPGLSLDPSGKLSALFLTQVGSYAFTVSAYDSRDRHVGSRQYTMNVNKKPGCIAFDFYNRAQIESIVLHHQDDKNKIDLPGLRGFCKSYEEARITQNYLAFPKEYEHRIQYKTNDVVSIEGSKIIIKKAGRASIEAIYLPNKNEEGASTSYHFTVERAVSNIALTVGDATYGDKIGLTAHVAGYKPTGSVQFFSDSHLLGTVSLSGHVAVLTVDKLSGGTHTLHAVYSGDANNQSSQSPIKNLLVRKTAGHISFPQNTYHAVYGEKFVFPQAQKKTASKGRLSYRSLNPEKVIV